MQGINKPLNRSNFTTLTRFTPQLYTTKSTETDITHRSSLITVILPVGGFTWRKWGSRKTGERNGREHITKLLVTNEIKKNIFQFKVKFLDTRFLHKFSYSRSSDRQKTGFRHLWVSNNLLLLLRDLADIEFDVNLINFDI